MNIRKALETLELKDDRGRHISAKPGMMDLAQQICEHFIAAYPQYVGGEAPIAKRHAVAFYKAAVLCHNRKEDPKVFVIKQLRGMAVIGKFYPRLIYSEVVTDAGDDGSDVKLDIIRHYKAQLALFDSRCKLYGPLNALTDEANDFSPLFRYVVANEYGIKALADTLVEAARKELLHTPSAGEVFGDDRLRRLTVA